MTTKRVFDLLVLLVASPIIIPVYLICMILLVAIQGRPIHFNQERVGLNGKVFRLIKFRSMVENAEELGGVQTLNNDNRITPVGKFIRKTSLDELPQLVNVLRGDMSLVGPRPYLLKQRAQFCDSDWNRRLLLPPGITGLAQVSGRSTLTVEERIKLDLDYIEKQSAIYDITILLKTIKLVCLQKGVN